MQNYLWRDNDQEFSKTDSKPYLRNVPNAKQQKSKEITSVHDCKTTENERLKENVKATKNKEHVALKGATIKLMADVSAEMIEVKSQLSGIRYWKKITFTLEYYNQRK